MSAEIARHEPLEAQVQRAKLMADAGEALPRQYRGNPAALLVAFEYADALGIPRVNAMTGIHIVDGKPTASADLIAALVRKAGHKLRVSGDETYAEAQIIRADDPDFQPAPIRWDEARARKAGLWTKKGPWQQYPGAMLRSRAITEAARMWASDALYGVIYTEEEISADDRAPRRVESEQVQQPSTIAPAPTASRIPDDLAGKIADADDPEWLEKSSAYLASLPDEDPATVADLQALIAARLDALAPTESVAVETLQDVLDADVVDEELQS